MCTTLTRAWSILGADRVALGTTRRACLVLTTLSLTMLSILPVTAQDTAANASSSASAAAPQALEEVSLEALLGLEAQSVFGASKFLQKLTEAPAAVSIVTADDIERYGWRTLADVLRNVRGFYVTDDRSWAYAGVRGFQRPGDYNTRLLLTVDGRRFNDNIYDGAAFQEDFQVDLLDVERIEIIRGPASSLYGSNAFFGVINVVTKAPGRVGPVRASVDVGTLGLRTGRISAGGALGDGVAGSLSATFQDTDGVEHLYFPEFDDAATNFGMVSGLDYARRQNMLGTLQIREVTVRSGFNSRTRGMPTAAYETAFGDPRAFVEDSHFFTEVAMERQLASGWTSRVRGAYDRYEYLGHFPYAADEQTPGAAPLLFIDTGDGDWLTGELQFSRRIGSRHRLTAGVEHRNNIRQDQTAAYEGEAPDFVLSTRSATTGVFAQDEVRLHRTLLLNLGLRYDQYRNFANPLKPRLAAVYQPGERTAVKFLFGEAFRAPNTFEMYYENAGVYKANVDLGSEEIRTTEVVVEQFLGRRIRMSGSTFLYDMKGLVDLRTDPSDGLFWYQNVDAVRATGVETEVEAKWPAGVQARLSHTFTRARDRITGDTLTNSPAHVTQVLFSVPLVAGTVVGVDARSLSERLLRSGGVVGRQVVANATLSGRLAGPRLRFSFTVENLTDRQYFDPVGPDFLQEAIRQNGRTARLRLIWSL